MVVFLQIFSETRQQLASSSSSSSIIIHRHCPKKRITVHPSSSIVVIVKTVIVHRIELQLAVKRYYTVDAHHRHRRIVIVESSSSVENNCTSRWRDTARISSSLWSIFYFKDSKLKIIRQWWVMLCDGFTHVTSLWFSLIFVLEILISFSTIDVTWCHEKSPIEQRSPNQQSSFQNIGILSVIWKSPMEHSLIVKTIHFVSTLTFVASEKVL